ncbi:MAG: S-layer protein domain-containing protein, partial [Methanosarcinaceae archaeon]|nr:S-layer protein domain-containing protein [Methanosarcinaceae archaeon]
MKRFAAVALAALMLLSVFAASASAAAIADTVEVRSEVYEGADIPAIVAANGGTITINATSFAGFFYDIDDDVKTEELLITAKETNTKGNKIAEGDLKYVITPDDVDYEFEAFGNYSVAGFFAEEFVPVFEDKEVPDNSVLAKLVLDDDEAYTLRTGEELDLGNGYAIEAKQVDVDGKKAWLTFTKDGEFVED